MNIVSAVDEGFNEMKQCFNKHLDAMEAQLGALDCNFDTIQQCFEIIGDYLDTVGRHFNEVDQTLQMFNNHFNNFDKSSQTIDYHVGVAENYFTFIAHSFRTI